MLTQCRCHGPAVFTGIIDPSTGKSIINGKRITGFTDRGENEENIMGIIKSWGHPTVEEAAAICGATCELRTSIRLLRNANKDIRRQSQRPMGRLSFN